MLSRLIPAGLVLCAAAGCHTWYPYCNSCGPGTGYPQSQIYTTPSLTVPSTVQPGMPAGGVPAGGGSNAPPFNPTPDNPPPTGGGNLAPDYPYEEPGPDSDVDPQFNVESEPFGAVEQDPNVEITSVESSYDEDDFVAPIEVQPASTVTSIGEGAARGAASRPDPYLYDDKDDDFNGDGVGETYEWLRGVLDYDLQRRKWQITYNADPTDKNDKYGGTFTLSNDDILYKKALMADDVVLIDGRVDIENVNYQGKPTYRVENVKRLEPE